MTGKSQSKIYSVFSLVILLLLTLVIGNLIYNIQNLDIPPETRLFYPETGGNETAVSEVADSGEGLRWFFIGVVILLFSIAIGGIIISIIMRKSMLSRFEIIGYLAVTVFLAIFFLLLPDILNSLSGLLGTGYGSTDGNGNGGTDDVTTIGFGFPIGGVLILIMVLSIVTYFLVSRSFASMRGRAKTKIIDKEKGEMLRYVEDAIVDLEMGGDPRDVIIRCYRNLCALLGGKGISLVPHFTPREFENLVIRKTGLKGENLRKLTNFFEEARYSAHKLTESDRDNAVRCLKDFRSEIESMVVK